VEKKKVGARDSDGYSLETNDWYKSVDDKI